MSFSIAIASLIGLALAGPASLQQLDKRIPALPACEAPNKCVKDGTCSEEKHIPGYVCPGGYPKIVST